MPSLSFKYPHEQYDFSPWVYNNLELLEEFGIRITGKELEAWCNTGRVDILAVDEDGAPVVVENQFNSSDGSHFRRLIGYMNDFGARKAIWIAEEFNYKHIEAVEKAALNGLDISLVRASLDDSGVHVSLRLVERFVAAGSTLPDYLPLEISGQEFRGIDEAGKRLTSYWNVSHNPLLEAYKKGLIDNQSELGIAVKSYLDSAQQKAELGFSKIANGCLRIGRYWTPNSRGNDIAPPAVKSFARLDIFTDYTYSSHLKARRSIREGQTLAVFAEGSNQSHDNLVKYRCICVTPKDSVCIDAIARSYAHNNTRLSRFLAHIPKGERLFLADVLAKELSPSCSPEIFRSWLEIGLIHDYLYTGPRQGTDTLATELGDNIVFNLISYDQLIRQEDQFMDTVVDIQLGEYQPADPVLIDSLYNRIKYGGNPGDSTIAQYKELRFLISEVGGIVALPEYFLPIKTSLDLEFLSVEDACKELIDAINQHQVTEWRKSTPLGNRLNSCKRNYDILRSLSLLFNKAGLSSYFLSCLSYMRFLHPAGARADYDFLSSIIGDNTVANNIDGALNYGEVKEQHLESGQFKYLRLSATISRFQEYKSRYSDVYALGSEPKLLTSAINKIPGIEKRSKKRIAKLAKDRHAWMCRNIEVQPFHAVAGQLQDEFSSILCQDSLSFHSADNSRDAIVIAEQLLEALMYINL